MKAVLTSAQMAAADAYTIRHMGDDGLALMERAARACTEILLTYVADEAPIAIVVGGGNNGGDGLVMARLLKAAGYGVQVYLTRERETYRGPAATSLQKAEADEVPIQAWRSADFRNADHRWTVDALFGTGLNRGVEGEPAEVIRAINDHPANVFAVDLPSGLSGSSGAHLGEHVQADVTVAIQHLKMAHVLGPACLACGEILVVDIGIRASEDAQVSLFLLEAEDFGVPPRPRDAHKGTFGTLGVFGGFTGMEGAANLCALAAARFGAGKVRIFSESHLGRHDSIMAGLPGHLIGREQAYDAMVIGPGLSRGGPAYTLVDQLNLDAMPTVWDADGLYYLKARGERLRGAPAVLTPHPGEAAMLLEISAAEVQADRFKALNALGERFPEAWLVLKGYRTLIRTPDGDVVVCGAGNAALATAGSGDVLSGMLGALLAQGLPPEDAVTNAVLRHAMAADRWVRDHPAYAMIAEDLIEDLKN